MALAASTQALFWFEPCEWLDLALKSRKYLPAKAS